MAAQKKRNAGGVQTKIRQAYEENTPERFESPVPRNMSPGQYYRLMGYHDTGHAQQTHAMQGTLFPHEHGLENPPRWEDFTPEKQKSVLKAVGDYGVTVESAMHSFGTQLDRAMHEEDGRHESFYSSEGTTQSGGPTPREVLKKTMRDTGAPWHEVVTGHSITSPQVRFATRSALGGRIYPNDQGARSVLRNANAGKTGEDWKSGDRVGKAPMTVLNENVAKGIDAVRAEREGVRLQEATNDKGRPLVGPSPKVRPYHNTLLDPHSPEGNYFVSDRHSGVSGMAPHVAEQGSGVADAYMKVAGVHAFHDMVARRVLDQRGMSGQVNRAQSAQWSQQKAEKGQVQDVMDVLKDRPEVVHNRNMQQRQVEQAQAGQERLF